MLSKIIKNLQLSVMSVLLFFGLAVILTVSGGVFRGNVSIDHLRWATASALFISVIYWCSFLIFVIQNIAMYFGKNAVNLYTCVMLLVSILGIAIIIYYKLFELSTLDGEVAAMYLSIGIGALFFHWLNHRFILRRSY